MEVVKSEQTKGCSKCGRRSVDDSYCSSMEGKTDGSNQNSNPDTVNAVAWKEMLMD